MISRPHSARAAALAPLRALDRASWATVALELAARAALTGAVVATARGSTQLAVVVALAAQALAVVRGVWLGIELERRLLWSWSQLARASATAPLGVLARRGPEQEAGLLVFAAQRHAQALASTAPRVVAGALGLVGVACAVAVLLGLRWLLAGSVAFVLAAAATAAGGLALRRIEREGYERLTDLVDDCGLLLDGALELRAHGFAAAAERTASARAALVARARRRATRLRSLSTMLPVATLALAWVAPGLRDALAPWGDLASVAVLGATAVAFGLGLAGAVGEWFASEPERRAYEAFLVRATSHPANEPGTPLASPVAGPPLDLDAVRFESVSVRHPGSARATPEGFSFRWDTRRGLALIGANGVGKSTLVAALLGLVPIETGTILLGTLAGTPELAARLRERVVYVSQSPFLAPARSVGWHLRLLCEEPSDAALERALEAVGLLARLRERSPDAPLDVPVGGLSGGELARMQLARTLLPRHGEPPTLVVVDEPEAGLDAEGRARARALFERLAETTPVLLVAHDESVVPGSFLRARCDAGA